MRNIVCPAPRARGANKAVRKTFSKPKQKEKKVKKSGSKCKGGKSSLTGQATGRTRERKIARTSVPVSRPAMLRGSPPEAHAVRARGQRKSREASSTDRRRGTGRGREEEADLPSQARPCLAAWMDGRLSGFVAPRRPRRRGARPVASAGGYETCIMRNTLKRQRTPAPCLPLSMPPARTTSLDSPTAIRTFTDSANARWMAPQRCSPSDYSRPTNCPPFPPPASLIRRDRPATTASGIVPLSHQGLSSSP
ncbi:hypothetical protein BDY21DRAFT_167871 [Lineolata rhizophorae]|uniref:Uncharacterized protein n=1 Tax=Lineolata rhizophorae TaxID=578093 RepID=A0A6A6P9K8_9PEZI|nr:hypothetical protein BDY21DRAFT_167871 [Lineolata rhizophorae]